MKTMCKCAELDCRRYGCKRTRGPIEQAQPFAGKPWRQQPFAGKPEHAQPWAGLRRAA